MATVSRALLDLRELELFAGLDEEELRVVEPIVHHGVVPGGTTILLAGHPADVVYGLLDGHVRLFVDQRGLTVTLAILGRGSIVGELDGAEGRPNSVGAVTLSRSPHVWMERRALFELAETTPGLALGIAAILARSLREATAHIEALCTLDVPGRVARQLLLLAREHGEHRGDGETTITLHVTQNDMAGMVGASRVRVNQALRMFRRLGWISVDADQRATLVNPSALASRCMNPQLARS